MDTLVKCGLDVKVVSLADGKDPDETVRECGAEGFMKYLAEALPVTEYKLDLCRKAYDLETYEGRSKYLKSALNVLKSLDDLSEREVYIDLVARLSRSSKDKLGGMLDKTSAEDKEKASAILEKLGTNLSAVVNMLIKQIIITEGIPFEVKMGHPVYSAEEAVNEVRATMAFEDMDLTEEDVRMLYAYKNGDVSGDDLRREILGGEK